MSYKKDGIQALAKDILSHGFRVFIAESGEYGFFTDDKGSRVCSFQYDICDIHFSGNYNSTSSGSGWRLDENDATIVPSNYREMLYASAPRWAIGRDPKWSYRTLEQHQEQYQKSSKYTEVK